MGLRGIDLLLIDGSWDIDVKSGPPVESEPKMTDKQLLFRDSQVNWVVTALVTALGIGVWDLLPGAAVVIMVGVAIASSALRLVHGSFIIANRLVSAELGSQYRAS